MATLLLRSLLAIFLLIFGGNLAAQEESKDAKTKDKKQIEDPFGEIIETDKKGAQDANSKKNEQEQQPTKQDNQTPAKKADPNESPFSAVPPEKNKADENDSLKQEENTTPEKNAAPQKQDDSNPFKDAKEVQPGKGSTDSTKPNESDATNSGSKMLTDDTGAESNQADATNQKTKNAVTSDPAAFESKFWEYLKSNAYENWAPVPGKSGDFYLGESPHGAYLKMYLNRAAAGNPDSPPIGSIIVKENYSVDRSELLAITVMYRSKGYNPKAGDWYWIKYNPDGTVAETPASMGSKKIMGKATNCIECHQGAEGNDLLFFNDKR